MLEFCHCWCFMMLKFCDFDRFCWKQYWRCLCAWFEWIETTMYSCVTFILFCIILLRSAAAVTCGWDNGLVPQQPGFYSDYGTWSLVVEWRTAHRTVPVPVWQKSCTLQIAHPCSVVGRCLVLKIIFFQWINYHFPGETCISQLTLYSFSTCSVRVSFAWVFAHLMQFLLPSYPASSENQAAQSIDNRRVRGKTIRFVLCNIVCNNCAQCDAHTWTD